MKTVWLAGMALVARLKAEISIIQRIARMGSFAFITTSPFDSILSLKLVESKPGVGPC